MSDKDPHDLLTAEAQRGPEFDAAIRARLAWINAARPNQIGPFHDQDWKVWLIISGRGWGKNLSASHAVWWELWRTPGTVCAAISPTSNDLIRYVFEGESGYCSVIPPEILKGGAMEGAYVKSPYPHIEFANGSRIEGYTAEKPDRLRGGNFALAHCDELAAWQRLNDTWSNMMFALRKGANPRVIVSTTPRPKTFIRDLAKNPTTIISRGTTFDNRANLAPSFLAEVTRLYEGTAIGRQELEGEILNPEEAGSIKRSWVKMWPVYKPDGTLNKLPRFDLIVISLDTAFSQKSIDRESGNPDPTVCQVWGVFMPPWEKPKDLFGRRVEPSMNVMLLDAWEEWLGFPELVKRVLKARDVEYGAADDSAIQPMIGPPTMRGTGRKADQIIIEDKGSGVSLRQTLETAGIQAYAYNPGNADKLARLHMVSHIFSNGLVWVPEGVLINPVTKAIVGHTKKFAKWAEAAIEQWCTFAGDGSIEHDDHVDAATQALRVLADNGLLQPIKRPELEPIEGTYARAPSKTMGNPYAA